MASDELTTKESYLKQKAQAEGDTVKVYDMYASLLNYKKAITKFERLVVSKSWLPADSIRRIKAYELLSSYYWNYSRDFRQPPETGDISFNDELSEMGDPSWICEKFKNKILGDKVTINIPVPSEFSDDLTLKKLKESKAIDEEDKHVIDEMIERLQNVKDIIASREAKLKGWFTDEMIYGVIEKNESKCSYLGDCVYHPYWDKINNVPKIKTYDAGYCFPDINISDESPGVSLEDSKFIVNERFFLAWELTNGNVYREVYELRLGENDTSRCFKHAAEYNYVAESEKELKDFTNEDLADKTKTVWTDLEIPFIPFVWVPNLSVEGYEPFGRSNLHFLLDIFDNIINTDSDLNTNSEYLGGAILAVSGENIKAVKNSDGSLKPIKVQPRSVYFLGKSGSIDVVDTSKMQTALLETIKERKGKLTQNTNIPDIMTGKISRQQMSGFALTVLMQPFIDTIAPMRQARQQPYSMLFYMVQYYYQLFGDDFEKIIFKGDIYDAQIQFGNIIPADRESQLKRYGMMGNIFSNRKILETAKDEGWNIDVDQELERLLTQTKEESELLQKSLEERMEKE